MKNLDRIQDSVKELTQEAVDEDFIYRFLEAYQFPKATVARLKESCRHKTNKKSWI